MDGPDVAHVQGVGYIVRSKSVPGAWRLVVGKTWLPGRRPAVMPASEGGRRVHP